MKTVLIIIVTYNGAADIRQCLTSYDNENPDMSCMIVDNGSTDETVEIIKNEFPKVRLVESGKNLGFGAANNIALRKAIDEGFDYVYLLNQDAWIAPEDIIHLIEIAEKNKDFGLISPLQVYAGKGKIDNHFSGNITKEMKDDFFIPGNTQKELYRVKETTLPAAHWLLRVDAIKKTGGFSPVFFHYGEDANLRRRMEYHKVKMGLAPGILAIHNREFRKNSRSYYLLMSTNKWKQTVSDPNLSRNRAIKQTLKYMLQTFFSFSRDFFPALFQFIRQLPQIKENRRKSIVSTTPFLYDDRL